jgi:hypothetical protein
MADLQPIIANPQNNLGHIATKAVRTDGISTAKAAPARKIHFSSLYEHMLALQSRSVMHDEGSDLETIIKTYYSHSANALKLKIKAILKSPFPEQSSLPKDMTFEIILRFILSVENTALYELGSPQNYADEKLGFTDGKSAQDYYEIQFGKTREEQFYNYAKLFKMLPSKILRRSKLNETDPHFINLKWLTQSFIDVYNVIEGSDPKLTSLYLARRNLIFLPKNILKLAALNILNLNDSKFTKIPPEIFQLTNLTVLEISHNNVTELPAHIFKLKNLQILNLGHNPIIKLPRDIGGFINFTKLLSLHTIKIDSVLEKKFIVFLPRKCTNDSRVSNCIPCYIDFSVDGNTVKVFAEVFLKYLILLFICAFPPVTLIVLIDALITAPSRSRR